MPLYSSSIQPISSDPAFSVVLSHPVSPPSALPRFPPALWPPDRPGSNVLSVLPSSINTDIVPIYALSETVFATFRMGDIFVLVSNEQEKGVLLELKGKGCRQYENFLLAQHRSWYDFLMDALVEGGVIKRLDLAINDMVGILDIPELTKKCRNEECISIFRSFKSYRSGELVQSREENKSSMGNTLYIGSLKSEVYFCVYEKDYEQYVKYDIPVEETLIKNRFEIRLKNERAYYAVRDLLTYHDAERTAFSIINRYVRFADKAETKRRSDWQTNERWAWFIGEDRRPLKLTTKPEPYDFQRTLNWLSRQVAPTLQVAEKLDKQNNTTIIKDMIKNAKLTDRLEKVLKQLSVTVEEMTVYDKED